MPTTKEKTVKKPAAKSKAAANASSVTLHGLAPYVEKKNEEYMNEQQREHFKQILKAWRHELMGMRTDKVSQRMTRKHSSSTTIRVLPKGTLLHSATLGITTEAAADANRTTSAWPSFCLQFHFMFQLCGAGKPPRCW